MVDLVIAELQRAKQMIDDMPFIAAHPDDVSEHFRRVAESRGLRIEETTIVERGKFYLVDPSKVRT